MENELIFIDFHDVKALDKAEAKVIKHYDSANGKELLHAVLVANVEFCNSVKDGSRLTSFFNRLAHTVNKTGIKTWLDEYTYWKLLEDKAGTVKFMSRKADGTKVFRLDPKGRETPFYSMSRVIKKDNEAWSLFTTMDKTFAAAQKHLKKGDMSPAEQEFYRLMLDYKAQAMAQVKAKFGDKPELKDVTPAVSPQVEQAPKMIEATSEIPFKIVEADAA